MRHISHRRIVSGAGAKLTTETLARAASFVVVLWAARQLGPADFGVYLYGLGAGFVLAQGADLGLHLLVAREVATGGRAAIPVVRSALRIKAALAAAAVLLLTPLAVGHAPVVGAAIMALGAAMVLHSFIEFAAHVFRGNQQLTVEVRLLTTTRLFAAAACAVVLWQDGTLLSLALVTFGSGVLGCALAAWMLARAGWLAPSVRGDGPGPGAVHRHAGVVVREALPLGIALVLSVVYLRAGWVLLYHLTGEEAVAQLGAAQRLLETALIVPAAVLAAVFPAYANALAANAAGASRLGRSSAWTLVLLGVALAGILRLTADWLVPALFGPAFTAAGPVLRVLAFALPLMFANYLLTHLVIARGAQRLVAWFVAGMLVTHLILSWQLIPRWGATGVAASMVVAESFLFVCCAVVVRASRVGAGEPTRPWAGWARAPELVRQAGIGALVVLAAMLPFEVAVWTLPGGLLTVTTLELLVAAAVIAAAVGLGFREGGVRAWGRGLPPAGTMVLVGFVAWLTVSALLAPDAVPNALRATARTAMGIALAGAVTALVHTRRELGRIAAAAVGGGLVAAGVGLWELNRGEAVQWLSLFRDHVTNLGAFQRLTASFDHANQASMFMEATAPLLVALVLMAWARGRRAAAVVGVVGVAVLAQATVLTYSRAGIITLISSLVLVGLLARRARGGWAKPWVAAGALTALVFALTVMGDPATRMRLGYGSPERWYQAELRAPPTLIMGAGEAQDVSVEVVNRGAFVWDNEGPHRVQVAALWISEPREVLTAELRWPLPAPVAPDQAARVTVPLRAPASGGDYRLEWHLVHEGVTWFVGATGQRFVSRAVVAMEEAGPRIGPDPHLVGAVAVRDQAPIPPGRATLWRVAAAELSTHPWTGVGLDNFRLRYGRQLGWEDWNQTVHANNWYLEVLVATGIIGGALFLGWIGLLGLDLIRVLRSGITEPLTRGVGAGLIAFLIHGLLDYFLLFHATGLLFWLLLGMWVIQRQGVGSRA